AQASANAEVKKQLGEPITDGIWVAGSIDIRNDAGNADLMFQLTGPKGTAIVHAVASKANGKWTFSSLEVQPVTSGDKPFDLMKPSGGGASKATPKKSP